MNWKVTIDYTQKSYGRNAEVAILLSQFKAGVDIATPLGKNMCP